MKRILLLAICLPTLLLAQIPQQVPGSVRLPSFNRGEPSAESLPENYEMTLTISDKAGEPTELTMLISSTRFNVQLGDPAITFIGTVTPDEAGNFSVAYSLAWETKVEAGGNTQFRNSSVQNTVRLKIGEETQIVRTNGRTARLVLKKVGAAKAP